MPAASPSPARTSQRARSAYVEGSSTEGDARPTTEPRASGGRHGSVIGPAVGLGLAALIAAAATVLSHIVGLGTGPVIGIGLGLAVGVMLGPRRELRSGVHWAASYPLRGAVVLLGAELPLTAVVAQGLHSLGGILITVTGCLLAAQVIGRRIGTPRRLRALIGVGTSICGASAIAAITPVIGAEETEVGYSVATIFLFNVAAVLLFPLFGHALGLGQHSFGVIAGSAVNDISSVVATATLYGSPALHTAVIVKLTRTLLIVPISIVLGRRIRRLPLVAGEQIRDGYASASKTQAAPHGRESAGPRLPHLFRQAAGLVPAFLVAFALLAALRGAGIIPTSWAGAISEAATLMITLALSAVGLSIDLGALRRAGLRPLALGATLWIIVSALSLGCQAVGLL